MFAVGTWQSTSVLRFASPVSTLPFENEAGRRTAASLLTKDEARRTAASLLTKDEARRTAARFAKLPGLLRKPLSTDFRYDLNSGHFAALR
jgi:hypothetical protein